MQSSGPINLTSEVDRVGDEAIVSEQGFQFLRALKSTPIAGVILSASPHLKSLTTISVAGVQFDWLFYGLAILVVLTRPSVLFRSFPLKFLILCAVSLVPAIFVGFWDAGRGLIDLVSLWLIYAASYQIVSSVGAKKCFDIYFGVSLGVAIWGIFELMTGRMSAYGLDGLTYEPSHYVIVSAPAVYYAVTSKGLPTWMRVVLPSSLLLTLSTTGLFVFGLMMIPVLRKRFVWFLILAGGCYGLWLTNDALQERVLVRVQDEAFVAGANSFDFGSNRTTASLLSNWHVAKDSFTTFFPLGCGYSNHHSNYMSVFDDTIFEDSYFFGTNTKSGHNLAIRWFSEFGLLGLVVVGLLVFRGIRVYTKLDAISSLILLASTFHFMGKSIKLGSYLDYGTPFFLSIIMLLIQNPVKGE